MTKLMTLAHHVKLRSRPSWLSSRFDLAQAGSRLVAIMPKLAHVKLRSRLSWLMWSCDLAQTGPRHCAISFSRGANVEDRIPECLRSRRTGRKWIILRRPAHSTPIAHRHFRSRLSIATLFPLKHSFLSSRVSLVLLGCNYIVEMCRWNHSNCLYFISRPFLSCLSMYNFWVVLKSPGGRVLME